MPGPNSIAATIVGVGHYLPETAFTSREVETRVARESEISHLPEGFIERLSGVAQRHYVANGESSSDLAAKAGIKSLANAKLEPSSIDLLIFASASHDVAEPATANIVQEKIGCTNAHVFDVKNACNSFINALDVAHAFIHTGRARRVLIAAGEVLSPFINWQVKDPKDYYLKFAALTLGDGGAACVLAASEERDRGVLRGKFFSNGAQWRLSTILAGGTLMKHDMSRMYFECESTALQALAVKHIPELIAQTLEELGWDFVRDVKLVISHQVSLGVIKAICDVTNYPVERCLVTLNQVGNTAAASIPIALSMASEAGRMQRGDKILLVGGAAGFSAGVIPVIW